MSNIVLIMSSKQKGESVSDYIEESGLFILHTLETETKCIYELTDYISSIKLKLYFYIFKGYFHTY